MEKLKGNGVAHAVWFNWNPLELISPRICFGCQQPCPELLCESCRKSLVPINKACLRCGYPTTKDQDQCLACAKWKVWADCCKTGFLYQGPAKNFYHAVKFEHYYPALGYLMNLVEGLDWVGDQDFEAIIFVPERFEKMWRRPFNPAQLVAQHLAKRFGIKLLKALGVKGAGRGQIGLDKKMRRLNPHFKVVKKVPNRILVVDDVLTTGATLCAATKVLRRAECELVGWFSLFRTL